METLGNPDGSISRDKIEERLTAIEEEKRQLEAKMMGATMAGDEEKLKELAEESARLRELLNRGL